MSAAEIPPVAVVAVPFPGQSHLNQLLHFSLILSARGIPVHFAAPSSSILQSQLRLHRRSPASLLHIQFHELPLLPPSPSSSPSPPHLAPALRLFETPLLLRPALAALIHSLSPTARRLVILHDTFMSVVAFDAASLPNTESYTFQCVSAFQAIYELNQTRPEFQPKTHIMDSVKRLQHDTPVDSGIIANNCHALDYELNQTQPEFQPTTRADLNSIVTTEFDDWVPAPILDSVERLRHETPVESGIIANSCRALDGEFVDLLAEELGGKKIYAVSPMHLLGPTPEMAAEERHQCLEWLDDQPRASVVYVCFGSTTTISGAQVEQLALGLQRSGQRFIWVKREADEGAIGSKIEGSTGGMPIGFTDETKQVGMVVTDWAPQVEILAHTSTAAFMSHCGWNSIMESLSSGVPIIAWPMQIDQPRNAMMVTEYLKVGVKVREWDRRKEVVPASRVEEVIRMMVVGTEGKEMRARAGKIGEEIKRAVAEGGTSAADLDSFVAHITRHG